MVDQVSSIHKALDSIPSTTNKLERTEEVLATEGFGNNLGNYLGATITKGSTEVCK